ncbi:hypothetical protein OG2516_00339, partial [Oceanicola granulosus HTCC2516]
MGDPGRIEARPTGPVRVEDLRETGLRAGEVDAQQGVVALRVERVLGRHHLAAEQPAQAAGVEVAAHERLVAEMLLQRPEKSLVGAAVGRLAVGVALAGDELRRHLLGGAADRELEVGSRQPAGKAAV